MSFTVITKPSVGDPVKKQSLVDPLIDNATDLNARLSTLEQAKVVNFSFEIDSDSDGEPDGWTVTLYDSGASGIADASSSTGLSYDGRYSLYFTRTTGGTPVGGGYAETTDFLNVKGGRDYFLRWASKSTDATIKNVVEVVWYDEDQATVSTSTAYSAAAGNPTSWRAHGKKLSAPSTARFAKIRLIGGAQVTASAAGDVAATVYFDAVEFDEIVLGQVLITADTTIAVDEATQLLVSGCAGGGGGGGGKYNSGVSSATGAGGDSGGFVVKYPITATAGETLTIDIGTGGAGAAANSGAAGSDGANTTITGSTSGALLTLSGGKGGGGATATVAGTADYYYNNWNAVARYGCFNNGQDGTASTVYGGHGGFTPFGHGGVPGALAGDDSGDGDYGAGGAGGNASYTGPLSGAGGDGGAGMLIIEWVKG